jgi:hypothetical protein
MKIKNQSIDEFFSDENPLKKIKKIHQIKVKVKTFINSTVLKKVEKILLSIIWTKKHCHTTWQKLHIFLLKI